MMFELQWKSKNKPNFFGKIKIDLKKYLQKKQVQLWSKMIISLFFLWWIFFQVDWRETGEYLRKINFWEILIYAALYFLGMWFSVRKWKFLAERKNIHNLSERKFFQYYFAATFVNNFAPSFIGGDAFKTYQIGKWGKKYKAAASSVIVDRITGLWGAMILALFFSVFNQRLIFNHPLLLFILFGIIGVLVVSFLILKKPAVFNLIPFSRARNFFHKAVGEINSYDGNGEWVLARAVFLSFFFNFAGVVAANYFLFWALGINVPIMEYLAVIFLISIVSSVPLTINNIGIKEWAYVTFFGFLGAQPAPVLAIALLSRILQMIFSLFSWPIYLKNK